MRRFYMARLTLIDHQNAIDKNKKFILPLDGQNYRIIELISETGGSCLVYKAERLANQSYVDNADDINITTNSAIAQVVIKEFYPSATRLSRHIFRQDCGNLIVDEIGTENVSKAKSRFISGANKQIAYFADDKMGHSFGQSFVAFYRDIPYIVSDFAGDFSLPKINREGLSLLDIVQIMVSLCNAVHNLHYNSKLHLDIKPDNVFLKVYQKGQSRDIVLFDFDTVVSDKNDLPSVGFYSEGWSPYEQEIWDINNISEKTDIFAMGGLFYWLLTGEIPPVDITTKFLQGDLSNFDSCTKLQGEKNDTHPAAIAIIKRIFSKTIANIENRYRNVDMLRDELLSTIGFINEPIYLLPQVVDADSSFIGRDAELKMIDDVLSEYSWCNVIGMPGIGKTEVVRKYAEYAKSKYHTVCFVVYSNSLKITLANLQFSNEERWNDKGLEKRYDEVIRRLNKADSGTLVLIDNYDFDLSTRNEEEDELSIFKEEESKVLNELRHLNNGSGARVVFSTRNKVNPYGKLEHQEVEIPPLSNETLHALFIKHCPNAENNANNESIHKLIETVEHHTLVLVLAAGYLSKMPEMTATDIELFSRNLHQTTLKLKNDKNIISYKDRQPLYAKIGTVYSHIKALLDITGFSEEEKYVLRCLCLVPPSGVSISLFRELSCNILDNDEMSIAFAKHYLPASVINFVTSTRYDDIIIEFQHKNIIIVRDNRMHCHTMLSDVLFNELQPQIHGEGEVKFEGNTNVSAKKAVEVFTRANKKIENLYPLLHYEEKTDAEIADSIATLLAVDLLPYMHKAGIQSMFAMNLLSLLKEYGKSEEKNEIAQIICYIGFKYANATWADENELYAASMLLASCEGLLNYSKEDYWVMLTLIKKTPSLPKMITRHIKAITIALKSESTQQLFETMKGLPDTTIEDFEDEIERTETLSPFLENHAKSYSNFANNYFETTHKNYVYALLCRIIGKQLFYLKNKVERRVQPIEGCISVIAIEEAYHLEGMASLLSKLTFRDDAIRYLEKAVDVLTDSVSKNNSVLINVKLSLIRLYTLTNKFDKAWRVLAELKKLNLSGISMLNNENVYLVLREARLLYKINKSEEALSLLNNGFSICNDDLSVSMLYDEISYIESENNMFDAYLESVSKMNLIYKKTLSALLSTTNTTTVDYKLLRANVLNGKVPENGEKLLNDYINYLSDCYLPMFSENSEDRIWSLLRHDSLIFSIDFDVYPDFLPLKYNPKTDFVWKYNALYNEQKLKNTTKVYHEYRSLIDGKKYSQRDIFKLMMDMWILVYRPDDEDLLNAYDTAISMYKLLGNKDKSNEYARKREVAIINGQLVQKILAERRVVFWKTFLNESYNEQGENNHE